VIAMPNAYITNYVPTTYGQIMSAFVEMLVSAGWTYKASGDGLSGYNATGKVFVGVGSGANGWGNNKAWARLADPAGVREIVIQHDNNAGTRIKYSRLAKFTGGTPSSNTVPSATDEKLLYGSGTDAAPTFGGNFWNTGLPTGVFRFQGAALATAPYGFWLASVNTTNTAIMGTGFMMDPVTSAPEDPDPVVWHVGLNNAFTIAGTGCLSNTSYPANGGTAQAVWGFNDAAASFFDCVVVGDYNFGGSNASAGALGPNPFNSKHDAMPIAWGRPSAQPRPGLKGWSTLMRWASPSRTLFLDTLDNKKWICVRQVWLPWDGLTVPLS